MLISLLAAAAAAGVPEYGSYHNPHPRPFEHCDNTDLVKLSSCCNDVLERLDDCKANDLACECCALQLMDPLCYNLCPGNPSTNFLTVLFNDCAPLNDVNACNLPFKKVDGENEQPPEVEPEKPDYVSLKSQLQEAQDTSEEPEPLYAPDNETEPAPDPDPEPKKPTIHLLRNFSSSTFYNIV